MHGKMTNYGLSCMHHPHAEFPDDHAHTLLFSTELTNGPLAQGRAKKRQQTKRAARLVETQRQVAVAHPNMLPTPVACGVCGKARSATVMVPLFDATYQLVKVCPL